MTFIMADRGIKKTGIKVASERTHICAKNFVADFEVLHT
jgi:hypothetical protein